MVGNLNSGLSYLTVQYSKTALNTNFLLRFSAAEETSAEDFLNVANINELSDSSDWSIRCNLNCYECGENSVGFEASVLHMSQKHTKASKVFRCISCPKSFARKDHLRNHVRRHVFIKDTPSDSQQWSCKQCDHGNKVKIYGIVIVIINWDVNF